MIHGINNDYLYAVTKLEVVLSDGLGNQITSSGTGFWVSKDENVYLITNRHIVQPGFRNPQYSSYSIINSIKFDWRSFDPSTKHVDVVDYTMVSYRLDYAKDDIDDIACISNVVIPSGAWHQVLIPFSMLATDTQIDTDLSVCDHVAFIGFPAVYDHKNNMPVLRNGVISSDPRLDFSPDGLNYGHIIAYEAFSTSGASGSPAFATQKGFKVGGGLSASAGFYRPTLLVGINAGSFSIGQTHQQMSYMYKSNQIINIILFVETLI